MVLEYASMHIAFFSSVPMISNLLVPKSFYVK